MKKGRIKDEHCRFIFNNEVVAFKRDTGSGTYEDTYFHNDGSKTYRRYKSGFLERERHEIPVEGGGRIVPYITYYLQGRLAFTAKMKWKQNFIAGSKN